MTINTHGGGARTNLNGLAFEQNTSLEQALIESGYRVINNRLVYNGDELGIVTSKHGLYRHITEPNRIRWSEILSKKMLPDDLFFNFTNRTVYIIEKKFQNGAGSVDEKLQTCDFKLKQYQRLLASLNVTVRYMYIFNDWFAQEQYNDVKEYIRDVGCSYYFNSIPITELGIPTQLN